MVRPPKRYDLCLLRIHGTTTNWEIIGHKKQLSKVFIFFSDFTYIYVGRFFDVIKRQLRRVISLDYIPKRVSLDVNGQISVSRPTGSTHHSHIWPNKVSVYFRNMIHI